MMQQQQLHVKNNFQLFVPLGGGEARGFAFTQTTSPSFGLTLTKTDINESWHYQVQLIKCDGGTEVYTPDGISWAKRTPYRFQTRQNSNVIEGLILQLKVEPGVFDFRRVKHNTIRFQINCYSGTGKLLSTGSSLICKLLPKRRVADEGSGAEPEVVVPIQWHVTEFKTDPVHSSSEPSPNYYSSPYEDDDSVMIPANNTSEDGEGSFEAFESPDHVLEIEHYPINERQIMHTPEYFHDEHFMVLYNGNAEVIGNFRALNFYKASDINIKEDIHLLSQDRNPRDVLMKIDGVEYKFKQGVRGNNDANRRFVGYIAQQIESVVPQAVQLIDGILHVDYESLIPYLSESIKQNFNDINSLNSKTDQIHQVVDMLYNEFMKKEGKKSSSTKEDYSSNKIVDEVREYGKPRKGPWKWIFGTSMAVLLIVSIAIGAVFVWPIINSHDRPLSPVITSPITPNEPFDPIVIPPPLTAEQLRELAVLEEFYNEMKGRQWLDSRNWMTNVTACRWYGVKCDEDDRVIVLGLTANGLSGSIPASIGNLDRLQELSIDGSLLEGAIPDSITRLQHLKHLSLKGAALQGTVPAGIFSLPELQTVVLEGNKFSAWELPSGIKYSSGLVKLVMPSCNIFGTMSESFGTLRNLTEVRLSGNNLHGTLPSFVNTSLQVLIVDNNRLSGSIPSLPSSIIRLVLKINNFTGGVEALADLRHLSQLDLSENSLSGQFELPKEVMDSVTSLDVAWNSFESVGGAAPNFKSVRYCDLGHNNFACPVPDWVMRCSVTCV